MRPSAALNHGKRCVEELDKFDHLMGWTFRKLRGKRDEEGRFAAKVWMWLAECALLGLSKLLDSYVEDDLDREIRSAKLQELSRTAFGVAVDVPSEFVAPVTFTPLKCDQRTTKQKKKTATSVQSNVYCKRTMGTTASSAARSTAVAASSANSSSHKSTKKKSSQSSTTSLPRKDSEPVDFIYDVSVRRKLREEIDSDRANTLHEAAAKEAQLRAANKWVYDKTDHRPARKQAWNCTEHHQQQESHPAHAKPASSARTGNTGRRAEAKATVRASSATSSRSSSSSTHSKSSKPVKSSIAPNVSEWRTQAFPVYPTPETATAEWKRAEQQRRQQQWREAKDVHDTIDDFESRMHQLAI